MSDKNGSVPKEKYRAIMMFAERGDVPVSQKDRGTGQCLTLGSVREK